jgi:hypothetical protein
MKRADTQPETTCGYCTQDRHNECRGIVLVQKMVIPCSTPSFLLHPLTNQTSETLFKCVLLTIIDYHPNTKTTTSVTRIVCNHCKLA